MRILPIRTNHVGGCPDFQKAESHGCRYRSGYAEQTVPLWNVFGNQRGNPSGGAIRRRNEGRIRRCPMSTLQKLDRRSFLKTGAAAAGGLVLGFYLPESHELEAQNAVGKLNAYVQV